MLLSVLGVLLIFIMVLSKKKNKTKESKKSMFFFFCSTKRTCITVKVYKEIYYARLLPCHKL